MHRNLLIPVLLLLGTAVFVSCGGADKSSIAVPKDAAFVFHINAPSLSSKLSWAEIKATNWFKTLHADADDSVAQQLLDNPENSGINTSADLAVFAKRRGKGGYLVFEGTLKDAAAFEAFNKKMKKGATTTKDGDLSFIKENDNLVSWSGSKFIYMANAPFLAAANRYMDNSSLDDNAGTDRFGNFPADSLVKFTKELFSLSGDNSLFSDKRFANLIKEPGDLHLWFSAEHMYGTQSTALNMLKLGTIMEGNITAGSINFENGKITMQSKSYYNKELAKLYEKYQMKNFDAAVLNRIPSQNICGLFSMNYPPEGLKEFMKVLGVDGLVNEGLSQISFTMDEFVKANKGEVLLAVTDFQLMQQQFNIPNMEGMEGMENMPRTITRPDFKVLFAASINDKAAFIKMVNNAKEKMGDLSSQGGLPPISYSMNDNWFAASNSEEIVNKFLAGGNNNWAQASKLSGHPAIFYLDLQKIMQPMAADSTSQFGGAALQESLKMWQDITGTGGELVDGAMIGNFEVNLVDKNTNALKQLNLYIDKLQSATRNRGAF